MEGQFNLFDLDEDNSLTKETGLKVVKATFEEQRRLSWQELFEGFEELYAITYSSGLQFVNQVLKKFAYAEIIFGFEGVLSDGVAAIMAMQAKALDYIANNKSVETIAQRLNDGSMSLYISRDTKSHEKIYILKSKEGNTRVITGSANMSLSAFGGVQRENIVYFDDPKAYEYYKSLYEDFKENCSDNVNYDALCVAMEDEKHTEENIAEVPIIKTLEKKKMVIIEKTDDEQVETQILADIKGLEKEIKPMLPRKKEYGKIVLTSELVNKVTREHKNVVSEKKIREKRLPKMHVDYELKTISFNGKQLKLNPKNVDVKKDICCLENYMSSLSTFYGDWKQGQRDYFAFLNWYFASLFMPYLRYVGSKNNYSMTPFPVFGILHGVSDGSKSTFISLLTKLMSGKSIPLNSASDFTSTNIENLKRACEGIPINIDDLGKSQYDAHYEKVIKDDNWGLAEGFLNYPAVTITTNKMTSFKKDITKRAVVFGVGMNLDKEEGAKNARRINESVKEAGNHLYSEYARRMLESIDVMVEHMKEEGEKYFPDVFETSSQILVEILSDYMEELPDYVRVLTYSDYFGDKAVGKNAMNKIMEAWENDRKMFTVNKKKNTLTYTYADSSRTYELRYLQQELPPVLNANVVGSNLVMKLDKAQEVFGIKFKKKKFI